MCDCFFVSGLRRRGDEEKREEGGWSRAVMWGGGEGGGGEEREEGKRWREGERKQSTDRRTERGRPFRKSKKMQK
jgi:hypothetical protein